jgi:hypothetical protein
LRRMQISRRLFCNSNHNGSIPPVTVIHAFPFFLNKQINERFPQSYSYMTHLSKQKECRTTFFLKR